MRFLTRAVFVLALLGGLGYGSYAFGRYVLSDKLFGSSVVPSARSGLVVDTPSTVTRKTQYKGAQPRVEVQVMDAATAGIGPEPPSIDDLRKSAEELSQSRGSERSSQTPKTIVRSAGDDYSMGRSRSRNIDDGVRSGYRRDNSSDDEVKPRRRRRYRRVAEEKTTTRRRVRSAENTTARSSSRSNASNDNDVVVVLPETSSGESGNSGANSDSGSRGSVSSGSDSTSEETRPRRRRRTTETTRESTPRRTRERVRERPSRTIESPVPQAESSDSPVPQPE